MCGGAGFSGGAGGRSAAHPGLRMSLSARQRLSVSDESACMIYDVCGSCGSRWCAFEARGRHVGIWSARGETVIG